MSRPAVLVQHVLQLQREERFRRRVVARQEATRPIDPVSPAAPRTDRNTRERNWAESAGRRNTSISEMRVATLRVHQREVQLHRGQSPPPGRPTVAWREDRAGFCAPIARGAMTEHAAIKPMPGGFDLIREEPVAELGVLGESVDERVGDMRGVEVSSEHGQARHS